MTGKIIQLDGARLAFLHGLAKSPQAAKKTTAIQLGIAAAAIGLMFSAEIASAHFSANIGALRSFSAQSSQAQNVYWRHHRHCWWATGVGIAIGRVASVERKANSARPFLE